jgi:hypothetical protein
VIEALLILLGIATVFATGNAVMRLLAHRVPMLLTERVGLAWVLGAGVLPAVVGVVGPLVGASLVRTLVPAAAFVLWAAVRRKCPEAKMRASFTVLDAVLSVVIAAQAVFVAIWASRLMLGWDALLIWEGKARLIFAGNGAMPVAHFTDETRLWSHPHYPFGFAALGAWLHLCAGHVDEGWVRILGPLYWLSAVGIVAGATVRLGGSRTAGLVGAAALFFVPYVLAGTWNALTGYADFPLGVVFVAALSWLLRCEEAAGARLCGVLTAIATWTKMEGRYLWVTIVLVAMAILLEHAWKQRRWRHAATMLVLLALPGAVILGAWAAFLKQAGVETEAHHLAATSANLMENAWRIPYVAQRLWRELVDWESWSFLWPGVVLAIATLGLRREWRNAGLFATALGMVLGIIVVVFSLSTWPDYLYHMDLSLVRLILQLVPTALLAIALAIPKLPPRTKD